MLNAQISKIKRIESTKRVQILNARSAYGFHTPNFHMENVKRILSTNNLFEKSQMCFKCKNN